MILQKASRQNPVSSQRNKPNAAQLVLSEVWRVAWFSAALVLLLALVSYSAKDPSWSTWSTSVQTQNWLGRLGSILADVFLQMLGLSAFGIPVLLLTLAAKRPSEVSDQRKLSVWGGVVFLFSLSALLQCAIPAEWGLLSLKRPGGILGDGLRKLLAWASGDLGAGLFSLMFLACSVVLLFQKEVWSNTLAWVRRTLPLKFRVAVAGVKARCGAILEEWRQARSARAMSKAAAAKIPSVGTAALASPLSIPIPTPSGPVLQNLPEASPVRPAALQESSAAVDESKSRDMDELSRVMGSSKLGRERSAPTPSAKLPKISNRNFSLPSVSMLTGKAENKPKQVDKNWYLEKATILVQKLKDFGVEGEVVNISPGPVITVYEFKPASGVKIKEIANLSDDLTLALSVLSVRIVAPIPGKPVVGIEIPSPFRETVYFKDMIQETSFYSGDIRIPVVLGRLASGEPVAADLASMPHLLVAGSTGTGKSVFINTLISSLIFRFTPKQLKLILVDPKMVELSLYEGIPHLLLPVVVDSKKAVLALRWAVEEMERRYTKMHQCGVRHVDAYNEKITELGHADGTEENPFLPYIVVVIDEYADLMSVVPKDVELSIARLAQKARASGIHLVLATQRPSTDVVTGTIKANFPSRISFRVASSVDSKTILDRTGADRLLGNGDMLFHSAGFSTVKRMQGSFMSDSDVARVVEYLKSQGAPEYDEAILEPADSGSGDWNDELASEDEKDNRLFDAAVRLVSEKGEASISLIQRHLKIGYNRAASLMEELEREGIVAQATSNSKRRAVLVNNL